MRYHPEKLFVFIAAALMAMVPASHGAKNITWKVDMVQEMSLSTEDVPIKLVWDTVNTHSVHKFNSKDAFDSCDFTQATEICSSSVTICELTGLTVGNTYYYGCAESGHCTNSDQKLALTFREEATARKKKKWGIFSCG